MDRHVVGFVYLRAACGWPTPETDNDRAEGRSPVRYCTKIEGHVSTDHEHLPEDHPEHWRNHDGY